MTTRQELARAQNQLDDALDAQDLARDERDQAIVRAREEGLSVSDITKTLGISRSRYHQIVARIKMKKESRG